MKSMLKKMIRSKLKNDERAGFHLSGSWRKVLIDEDPEFVSLAEALEKQTSQYKDFQVTILYYYDGRDEMMNAANSVLRSGVPTTGATFHQHLQTGHLSERNAEGIIEGGVDLVIRMGVRGNPHWSGSCLPWYLWDTEFSFIFEAGPDVNARIIDLAFADYSSRKRKHGA